MPSPSDLVKPVLSCMGVNFALNIPSVTLPSPTLPGLPGFPPIPNPKVPPVTIPGLDFNFQFPQISAPGLPTMFAGCFGSLLAGIDLALGFIPPDPHHLPSIPSISFFIEPFIGAAIGMPQLPAANITIPGFGLTIPFPGTPGVSIPGFNTDGIFKLIGMFISVPFLLIKQVLTSIINLNLQIPGFSVVLGLLQGIGVALSIPLKTLAMFVNCLATGIANTLQSLL